MIVLKRTLESRDPSLSGMIKKSIQCLEDIRNNSNDEKKMEVVSNAISFLKKIAYARRKDMENGTDKAQDLLGNAIDTLFNWNKKESAEDVGNVLQILDDVMVRFL